MSSFPFNASPTLTFPEKFRVLGSEARDPLASPSSSFSSGTRSFGESGFSLTAISEEDEDEEEDDDEEDEGVTMTTDSTDARGDLLDTERMFASGRPTRGQRRYRVASVPSLWAIKEDDEDSDDDSLRSSLTYVVADAGNEEERGLSGVDSDSGWVWVDAEEAQKAPVSSADARPRRSRFRVFSWFKAL